MLWTEWGDSRGLHAINRESGEYVKHIPSDTDLYDISVYDPQAQPDGNGKSYLKKTNKSSPPQKKKRKRKNKTKQNNNNNYNKHTNKQTNKQTSKQTNKTNKQTKQNKTKSNKTKQNKNKTKNKTRRNIKCSRSLPIVCDEAERCRRITSILPIFSLQPCVDRTMADVIISACLVLVVVIHAHALPDILFKAMAEHVEQVCITLYYFSF